MTVTLTGIVTMMDMDLEIMIDMDPHQTVDVGQMIDTSGMALRQNMIEDIPDTTHLHNTRLFLQGLASDGKSPNICEVLLHESLSPREMQGTSHHMAGRRTHQHMGTVTRVHRHLLLCHRLGPRARVHLGIPTMAIQI